uniref:Collagen, type XXVIII, alpha 1b n=1 Tax=Salarias fasciatus TaxID=181472 RepID=A0A672FL64_SALFA
GLQAGGLVFRTLWLSARDRQVSGQPPDQDVIPVAFIVDSSEKARPQLFEEQKAFVLRFSGRLMQLRAAGWRLRVRLAAVQYSSAASVEHNFRDWQDLDVFQSRVAAMAFMGQGTYSAYAIANATRLFARETSSASLRVALLMTDGVDHPRSPGAVAAAAEAKQNGVRVFVVGLSALPGDGAAATKLRSIASAPPQQHVLSLTDAQLDQRLLSELCPQPKTCLCERGERGHPGNPVRHSYTHTCRLLHFHLCVCPQGGRGPPGDQGLEGAPGVKVRHGHTGLGERGLRGAPGPPGDTGTGFPGPKGDKGNLGRPGPPGLMGVGEPGTPVSPELQEVVSCSRVSHITDKTLGEPGFQGPAGPRGTPGEGLLGEKGDQGMPGNKGRKGDRGDHGGPGSPGPMGCGVRSWGVDLLSVPACVCCPGCGLKCSDSPLDLVFIIDGSESVGPQNFELVKDFVNAVVDQMTVSWEASRVGVVLYSRTSLVVAGLQQQAGQEDVKVAVRNMPYLGEGTFTGSAIHRASQLFLASRPGVRRVAVLVTDGLADQRDAMQFEETATLAHEDGIEVFVVGVVNRTDPQYEQFLAEMSAIASDPDGEHIYLTDHFRNLPGESIPQIQLSCTGITDDPPVLSCPVLFHPVLCRPVLSCPVPSCPVLSCPVLSRPVLSRPVLFRPILSCSFLSRPVLSRPVLFSEGCAQPLDPGPCRDYVVRWYYDPQANACAQFWFGSCQGNANNFQSEDSCTSTCVYT